MLNKRHDSKRIASRKLILQQCEELTKGKRTAQGETIGAEVDSIIVEIINILLVPINPQ